MTIARDLSKILDANGDLTIDTNTLFVDSSTNRVGIGTTSPTVPLEVNGGVFQQMVLRLGTSGVGAGIISFLQGDGTAVGHIGGAGSNGGLQLRTGTGTGTERMRIDTSGNVGIGTASPSTNLEVNGNIRVGAGSASAPSLQIGDNDTGIFDAGANAIGFTTAGSEKIRIVQGGSLAIGATSASQKLHVEGSIYTSGSLYVGGTGSANALDDYETGSWTPAIKGSTTTGTATYNIQAGFYVKIGTMVHIQAYLDYSSGTGTGNFTIGGLPFISKSTAETYSTINIGYSDNIAYTAGRTPMIYLNHSGSDTLIVGQSNPTGSWSAIPYDGAGRIIFAGTYITN